MIPKLAIVQTMVRKMFGGNHFSICDVDKLCEACGLMLPKEVYDYMRMLHCVDWRDMEPKTRKWVAEEIDKLFTDPDRMAESYLPQIARASRGPLVISGNFAQAIAAPTPGDQP